jgi:hypothetical protein
MNSFRNIVVAGLWLSAGVWPAGCAERTQNAGGDVTAGAAPSIDENVPAAVAQLEPPSGAEQKLSNAGSYVVSYVTHPHPIPMNEMFAIEFWVSPTETGQALTDAMRVDVDARMPHHHHGMYRVPLIRLMGGSGHYEAVGMLFHMPGYWEIYFDITHDGVTERAQFSVEID